MEKRKENVNHNRFGEIFVMEKGQEIIEINRYRDDVLAYFRSSEGASSAELVFAIDGNTYIKKLGKNQIKHLLTQLVEFY